jgi:hypothetical protein
MKFADITHPYKLFSARIKVKQPGYYEILDTTITAKDRDMARRLLKAQYGKTASIASIHEIR